MLFDVPTFWAMVSHYRPTLVTFNGRGFDLPVLELAALSERISVGDWFASRDRFRGRHLDLMDYLSNYGGWRMSGGLNMLAKRLGLPGKTGVDGSQVYDMWLAGKQAEIEEYCLRDVLDMYFVFLRVMVVSGRLADEEATKKSAATILRSFEGTLQCAILRYLEEVGIP